MGNKFAKLINVKSIVTLMFCIAFVAFVPLGFCSGTTFEELLKMIIIFYFGTQVQRTIKE